MSNFTKGLSIAQLESNKKLWVVNKAFDYHVGSEESKEVISIPVGYVTDGASIPRFLWSIVGHPLAEYAQSAVVHDIIYGDKRYTRKKCDQIFLEAMKVQGVSLWKRRIIYRALRMFGWVSWNKKK